MSRAMAGTGRDEQGVGGRVWRAREDLLYRKLVDGGILYDSLGQQVHHLNATAAFVWERCRQGGRPAEMVEQMCREYTVEIDRARADVRAILEAFARAELLLP